MGNSSDNIGNILSHEIIVEKAKEKWNLKDNNEKIRCGRKYHHVFEKLKLPQVNWDCTFEKMNKFQTNILIKGELIRTYDSMSNREKTRIKERFGLSAFSSKWFRMPSCDKKILLNSVLKHDSKNQ